MKNAARYLPALLLFVPTIQAEQTKEEKPKMRDIITHRELVARKRASEPPDPLGGFEKAEGEDPAKKVSSGDIISQSDFISSGGLATLVPKYALIHVPERFKDRTRLRDGMKIMTWPNFLAKNRSWITTMEVNRRQAEGNSPLDPERLESIKKTGDLIVATLGGSPVSVLPPKEPEVDETDTEVESRNLSPEAGSNEPAKTSNTVFR